MKLALMQVILEELLIMTSVPTFGDMINKEKESRGPDWWKFKNEKEAIECLQKFRINGFDDGYNNNPAGKEINFYKEKVEAVENFLNAFHIPRL